MKKTKWIIVAAAAVAVQLAGVSSGSAQQLYPAFVSATCISTNGSGELTYRSFRNRDIIRDCASKMGITNLTGLSLAYNRTADTLEVVSGTNKTVVCTPATFSGGTSLSNSNGTKIQRLTFVFWGGATTANGTLLASERVHTETNGMTFFNLRGNLQFSVAASGTNAPMIYAGGLDAGNGRSDESDEDDDR
ncbi:MAG TPA: hypothetical protein VH598_04000 [Verrucomicrobiae bacterium]|jgi:hypothetical protein|nr:hypothetical protein [Verrucomicrobiae bacterium]